MDESSKKILQDAVNNEFPAFIQMLEETMGFSRWGFRQTFAGVLSQFPPSVIYDSKQCRVRFMWHVPDIRDNFKKITVMYGRLHAPVDEAVIVWREQRCYCWHLLELPINFLDNRSPEEMKRTSDLPPIMEKYYQPSVYAGSTISEEERKNSQPIVMAKMHAEIWQQYDQRLFDLFDLQHPELWDQYRAFIKRYYEVHPRLVKSSPPLGSVC